MMCHTFAYYGLTNWLGRLAASRGIPHLDICLALAINALAEMPGLLLTVILIESVGRRWVLTGNLVGIILTCISMILFVNTQMTFIICSACLYFFIVSVWASIYIYLPELFPTQLRSRAFAVCSTFAKVGGMISPIVFGWIWDRVKASGDFGDGGVMVLSLVVGVYAIGVLSSVMLPVETAARNSLRVWLNRCCQMHIQWCIPVLIRIKIDLFILFEIKSMNFLNSSLVIKTALLPGSDPTCQRLCVNPWWCAWRRLESPRKRNV